MRTIDADALQKALRSNCTTEICHDCNTNWCRFCCPHNDFEDLIEDAPTIEEKPQVKWIAVKDKFPDKEGEYLVSLDNGRIVVADDRSIIENHDFEPKMMAWQPLPEPYRAEV